jgi:hypothetical protein
MPLPGLNVDLKSSASTSWVAGITGTDHYAQLKLGFFIAGKEHSKWKPNELKNIFVIQQEISGWFHLQWRETKTNAPETALHNV